MENIVEKEKIINLDLACILDNCTEAIAQLLKIEYAIDRIKLREKEVSGSSLNEVKEQLFSEMDLSQKIIRLRQVSERLINKVCNASNALNDLI